MDDQDLEQRLHEFQRGDSVKITMKKIIPEDLKRLLKQARVEIKAGKFYTHQQVKEKLQIK